MRILILQKKKKYYIVFSQENFIMKHELHAQNCFSIEINEYLHFMSLNQSDCVEERSDECQSLDLFIIRGISTNFS